MMTTPTLRTKLDELRASGQPMPLAEALSLIVPLAVEVAQQHADGYTFFLYPSALFLGEDGHYHASEASAVAPSLPEDAATLPPEAQGIHPGQARASVYGVAAIIYELITLRSVGPAMQRPSELAANIPQEFELILSKALVTDPHSRPDDLGALAQAFHQVVPSASMTPPAADTSHLDHDDDFDVDVSLSMLPPPAMNVHQPSTGDAPLPPGVGGPQSAPVSRNDVGSLMQLKQALEADPAPRYVVVKSGMDHGPFRAFELLQQIASHAFEEDDIVKDTHTGVSESIGSSANFSPFAHHARLGRHEKAEKAAIDQAVQAESRSTRGKSAIGFVLVAAVLMVGAVAVFTSRGQRKDEVAVIEDKAAMVDTDQMLKAKKQPKKFSGSSKGGGVPTLRGGMSCAAARNAYVEEMKLTGPSGPADLTAGAFGAKLNTGSYLNGCGISNSTSVSICAAIQNGRAVGVTVTTNPSNASANSCVASKIRAMSFPSHPKLDITTTNFAAQN